MVVSGSYRQVFLCDSGLDLVFDQEAGSCLQLFFYTIDPHGAAGRDTHIRVVCNQLGPGCTTEI